MGISPGASYGSAKRWYPEEFAKVATALSHKYDIYIFGSPDEKDIALDIENFLIKKGVKNFDNLSGVLLAIAINFEFFVLYVIMMFIVLCILCLYGLLFY